MLYRRLSIYLGNLFEHYDTALFGALSPFFAPLFFPNEDPITALLFTYMIIPLGMLARPLGALFFGYLGDQYGRSHALFVTLFGMGLLSLLIACIPTYQAIGILAPILLCLTRLGQNLLAGGEIMGGGIILLECTPNRDHDLISSIYTASTIAGMLLASLAVAFLGNRELIESHWRLLYIVGGVTAIFALCLRKQDTHSFHPSIRQLSIKKTLWQQRRALLAIACASGFSYTTYMIALILMNGFVPLISPVTRVEMSELNSALLLLDLILLPLFGLIASKISRQTLMIAALISTLTLAPLLFSLLEGANLFQVAAIRTIFMLIGVAFSAPLHAWVRSITEPSSRYIIIAFGYAIGSQLLGGPSALISLWLFQKTGSPLLAATYWMAIALLTLFVSLLHYRQKTAILRPL